MQTDMELFKGMAGIDLARIPYRGTAPAVLATLSGEVSVIIAPTTSALPHIRSGEHHDHPGEPSPGACPRQAG